MIDRRAPFCAVADAELYYAREKAYDPPLFIRTYHFIIAPRLADLSALQCHKLCQFSD
jgi:hypothetical protein